MVDTLKTLASTKWSGGVCRLIVASDAGCDPDYSFNDLGNALRKIWIDLDVRIDLHGLDRLKKRFTERFSTGRLTARIQRMA
jgi:hypothetical protein